MNASIDRNKLSSTEISVEDVSFSAIRPKGMMMNIAKFETFYKVSLPTLDSEIKAHLKEINR